MIFERIMRLFQINSTQINNIENIKNKTYCIYKLHNCQPAMNCACVCFCPTDLYQLINLKDSFGTKMFKVLLLASTLLLLSLVSQGFIFQNFLKRNYVPRTNSISSSTQKLDSSRFFGVQVPKSNIRMEDEEEADDEDEEQPAEDPSTDGQTLPVIFDGLSKEQASFDKSLNGSDVRVGIIMARWNEDVIKNLYKVR